MSDPAKSPATPVTPATPNRRRGATVNDPPTPVRATPGRLTPGRIMGHPSDVALFATIRIHTAKCSVCDNRNQDELMRRCPMCTWQACGECRKAKNDNLQHGTEVIAFGTPANRRPLPGIGGRSTPHRASPPLQFSPVPVVNKAATEMTPASSIRQKFKDAQEATPPTSGEKRKRDQKATKQVEVSGPSDDSGDNNFSPEPASPTLTMSRKRHKMAASSGAGTHGSSGSPVKRIRQIRQQKSIPSVSSGSSPPWTFDNSLSQGMRPSENKEEVAAFYGIPSDGYEQHPLSRSMPITNRSVRIPPNVKRNFKPRKSAAEFQHELQIKVVQKLEQHFGWAPRAGVASASESSATQEQLRTIRDVVQAEAHSFQHLTELEAGQMAEITKHMEEAALEVRDAAYQQMAGSFRASVAPGLDMDLDQLNRVQQQHLTEAVHEVSGQALKAFAKHNVKVVPSKPSAERLKR
ncbi:hypothetical protein K458DRAFT_492873 [Lentithecium fluviatile CBS 122367]|uniref:Uncharacterized protein n=1 Tax=Lentithecium fluviatile CBS 122367 TaxID=1168545 RepID=A0A6G1ICI5_9PLEO|nr:hypothetical protein K458DRAFT_492873 [Lentithecium fluviatile CBS 122367]